MDLLLIGGTRFSGRALAEQALAKGHSVTVFHRGSSGAELFAGEPRARHLLGDRNKDLSALAGPRFDAVVDFCGMLPEPVGESARLLKDSGMYTFISSISAYKDGFAAGSDEGAPVHEAPFPETDQVTGETYGPLKVACEQQVQQIFGERAAIVRPGFIVGPNDPTDRFPSLVRRAAAGGEMLLPGPASSPLQFVDASDLAAFCLHLAETGRGGTFHAVHPLRSVSWSDVVQTARRVAGADTTFTWADPEWLHEQLGEKSSEAFPLWAHGEEAFHQLDATRAAEAGLPTRPLEDTIHDTLQWDRGLDPSQRLPGGPMGGKHGLEPERERELLEAWRRR
jgi:2'-hydroxyisoflavone reductase